MRMGLVLALLVGHGWHGPALGQQPDSQVAGATTAFDPPGAGGALPALAPSGPQSEAAELKKSAIEVASQVAEAYPSDALTYALLGSAYYNTGRSEEATKFLRKCLELNPNQADAYGILARIAYEKGQLEESVRLSQEALKRAPPNSEVLNHLGRTYLDMGRSKQAIETLEQAVRLPRPVSESSYLLGQANLQAGNFAQAKESFRRATELLPDHTQAYFGLFTACMRLGQVEEAARYREQFQKLEAVDRKMLTDRSAQEDTLTGLPLVRQTVARTMFGAGQIHYVHKELATAADLFARAAGLDGDNLAYRAALEGAYVSRKAVPEAVPVFERLAVEQPESFLNYYFLGRLHSRLNQFEPAERAFKKMQDLAPGWTEGHRALTQLYLRADQKTPEALALARRLVQAEPIGQNYYLLAMACFKSNDRPGALEAARKAVELSPNDKRFQQLVEQLEKAR